MQLSEAKTALASKLNISLSTISQNGLFSESELADFIVSACQIAWDYRPWTFTLDSMKTTLTAEDLARGYLDYPNNFEDESIWLLTVAGKEWGKREFADFKHFLAENPTSSEKIWAEFRRIYFLNMTAVSVGDEVEIYGKLRPTTPSATTDKLPFSPENDNDENSGNRAIVNLAYAEALGSEKKNDPAGAEVERKKAFQTLDRLWAPMAERRARKQSQNRPFFNVPDFFGRNNSIDSI